MKTTTAASSASAPAPRLSCRVARTLLSTLGDTTSSTLRGPGAGHVAHCAACQAHFRTAHTFDQALTRDAVRQAHAAPAGLDRQIMAAIHREVAQTAAPVARRSHAREIRFGLVGALACVALTVLIVRQPPAVSSRIIGARPVTITPVPEDAAPIDLVPDASTSDFLTADHLATDLLAAAPLQREVDAVYSNAQSAVRFLEQNFFLSPPAEPAGGKKS